MPGKVLHKHGIVERNGDGYSLAPNTIGLSPQETKALVALCDEAIAKFKAARGAAIWEHGQWASVRSQAGFGTRR